MACRHCMRILGLGLLAASAFVSTDSQAELSVAPIFGDHMVLQRQAPLPVFGTADPHVAVTVEFAGESVTTAADETGQWLAVLGAMEARLSSDLSVSSGADSIVLSGVQVGEVWLCSGQSNMGWPLSSANDSAAAIAEAANHNIRLFRMTAGNGPATAAWQVSDSSTAGSFSAVCYWMGLELSQWLGDVPVGLIQATHDGSAIESWQHTAGGNGADYDAMVKAIQPYGVKAVLWYQGESNGGDAAYAAKLTSMIGEWRSDWAQDLLPFGIVQLAYRSGWNVARNAQLEVADTVADTFLVVIRDLPGGALHPPEKKPVGIRSAIGARGLVYGEDIVWSSPIRDLENSFVDGGTVVLNWKHTGGGLFTDDGQPPGDFMLAGENGRFKSADAAIVGETVEVWSSSVANPVKVQYSFRGVGNLYNHADVFTEGGTGVVAALKASEFEFTLDGGGNPPPGEPTTMHVSSLTAFVEGAGRGSKRGVAEVIVRDDQNDRVSGATVTVRFSGSFDESATGATDADGYVRLVTSAELRGGVVVNACVSDLQGTLEYAPNSTQCAP